MNNLTKSELERIYYENTNDKAAEILGITKATMIKYIKESGIVMKGKGVTLRKLNITG